MSKLKRLQLKGFRSIKDIDIEFRAINVLIGANGAGKSNFISFFKLLNEMMGERLQLHIAVQGRADSILHFGPKVTPQIEATLEFETETGISAYKIRLFHAAGDTLVFAEETLTYSKHGMTGPLVVQLGAGHRETKLREYAEQGDATARYVRHILNGCRVYHFHDTSSTAKVRQYSRISDNRRLMPDAANLPAMLYAYRAASPIAYRRIVSAVRTILPEFDDFVLEPDSRNPSEIMLNWSKKGSEYTFGPHQLSDGSLRAMALLTLFLQPQADLPDVILLDEPELGLHPAAIELIQGVIRAAAVTRQVVVATQSPYFVDFFAPEEVIVAESHDRCSSFRRLETEPLSTWLEDYTLSQLWSQNVIGGGPFR